MILYIIIIHNILLFARIAFKYNLNLHLNVNTLYTKSQVSKEVYVFS